MTKRDKAVAAEDAAYREDVVAALAAFRQALDKVKAAYDLPVAAALSPQGGRTND